MKNARQAIGICGSLRQDSFNRKLLNQIMLALSQHGIVTKILSSDQMTLPLLNEDLETVELHPKVLAFRQMLSEHPLVVIASPEYNGSISSTLKNAIDWATRPPGNLWEDKVILLVSASPGALGGARGLIHLRTILSGIKSWIIPEQVQCPMAHKAFGADGTLIEASVQKQIEVAIPKLLGLAEKLS